MAKKLEKYLTLKDLVGYNHKVMFPFMEETLATKKELEEIDKKLDKIATKEDVKNLNKKLDLLNDNLTKNNKLETRIDYMENILAIKKN